MLTRWTPKQLRAFLAWLDREWERPALTDHYLMRLMAEMSLDEKSKPEDYRIAFTKGKPQKRQSKAEKEAAQKAKDKLDSALWRGVIDVAGAVEAEKRKQGERR